MAWVTIDDQTPRHPKHVNVGPAASWLWVCGLAHCNSQLTNGFIDARALHMLGAFPAAEVKRLAERLCSVNLWERVDGGYQVHDYLEYQPSRDVVRERMRRRKASASTAARARWKRPRIEHGREPNPTQPRESADALSHTKNGNEGTTTDQPATDDQRGKSKGHRGHFFCGDRFCVPHFLFEEFDRQLGGADIERARIWMRQLDQRAVRSGEIIEDPIQFVRQAFKHSLKRVGAITTTAHEVVRELLDDCPHTPHCTSSRACQTLRDLAAIKEQMTHECTDSPAGRPTEGAAVETGRSYAVRHRDA
jgi:hypothetical protein